LRGAYKIKKTRVVTYVPRCASRGWNLTYVKKGTKRVTLWAGKKWDLTKGRHPKSWGGFESIQHRRCPKLG